MPFIQMLWIYFESSDNNRLINPKPTVNKVSASRVTRSRGRGACWDSGSSSRASIFKPQRKTASAQPYTHILRSHPHLWHNNPRSALCIEISEQQRPEELTGAALAASGAVFLPDIHRNSAQLFFFCPPLSLGDEERKMSVSGLKAELKFLESIFDVNHERFRILDWKPDELSCQFNVTGDQLLIIHCNLTVRRARALGREHTSCQENRSAAAYTASGPVSGQRGGRVWSAHLGVRYWPSSGSFRGLFSWFPDAIFRCVRATLTSHHSSSSENRRVFDRFVA